MDPSMVDLFSLFMVRMLRGDLGSIRKDLLCCFFMVIINMISLCNLLPIIININYGTNTYYVVFFKCNSWISVLQSSYIEISPMLMSIYCSHGPSLGVNKKASFAGCGYVPFVAKN